jgi:RecB family exonuclease
LELTATTTAYGRPALEALARVVADAKTDDPLAPVTVVVPSNHVGVTARRMLASGAVGSVNGRGRGMIGTTFLTPYRLAELLGAPALAAAGKRPVSTPVIGAALRQALRHEPGVFGPVAEHPATEEALVAAFGELADLSTGGLDQLAAQSRRAGDVVRLCRTARAALADRWYDEADLVTRARALLRGSEAPAMTTQLGRVVIYLPQDLTRRAAALLRELASHLPGTTVIVGLTGQPKADAGVRRSLARLGLSGDALAAAPDPPTGSAAWPVDQARTRIVTTSDADDEVRTAVRVVLDAVRDGVPLERMAVLYPAEMPYNRLVHEHVAAAGIPSNGQASQPLKGRVLGRTMLNLLALRDHNYRRRDVLGLLTSAPLRARENGVGPPIADWERMSRQAAVVAGRDQWDRRLAQFADELDRRAVEAEEALVLEPAVVDPATEADTELEPDVSGPRVLWERRRVERVHELRSQVLGVIDQIEAASATPRTWRQRVRWLRRLAADLLGPETDRETWPFDERKAAERVDAALDRLVALDDIDGPVSLDVFRRTLELELDADLGRAGRLGEGVLVGPLSLGVGLDLDLVVVLGMAEGVLPSRPNEDSLLPDAERRVVGGELNLRRDHIDRQQRQLHAALSTATDHVLCAPRGDLRASNEHVLSRWLVEMTSGGGPNHVVIEHVPSFAHGVTHVANPATEQEYRLRDPAALDADPIVRLGREMRDDRRSDRFTRFDGNLSGRPVRSPLDDIVSATRLESWAVCPHAYFLRQILRIEPVEDPADTLWITPLARGSLVHEVLEHFLGEVLVRPEGDQPPPDRPWTDDDRRLLHEIATATCAAYEERGLVGRSLFWERDRARILSRLDRFLHEDDTRRRTTRSRPIAAELAFGLPGVDLEPVDVPIADGVDGRMLRFRGAADRIDLTEDGGLRVIDYKTGRPDDYRALSPANPDDRGTHLQLVVYGVAARAYRQEPQAPVTAEYWFIGDRPGLTTIGYEVTDEVLTRVGTTLATIVDGIEHGVFPARPTASSSDPFVRCRYCDPDGLGVTDRRRAWERKRRDPALVGYARLAEPDAEVIVERADAS